MTPPYRATSAKAALVDGCALDSASGALSPLAPPGDDLLNAVRDQFIVSITDARGTILEVNDAFCEISKYARCELIGSNHRLINSGRHRREFFAGMWRRISSGKSWRGEICNRAGDGSEYWVDSVITPLRDAFGNIERFVSVRSDITERVQQRQALEAANEQLTLATEGGHIGIWDLDLTLGTLTWDARIQRIYGLPEGCHFGSPTLWLRCVHEQDCARIHQAFDAAVDGVCPLDVEFRVIWPNNTTRHVRSAARVVHDPSGRALRMVGVSWDVTSLRNLSAELADQHELMRVTLESIGDAVITTDAMGNVTWQNPAAERMTGWRSPDAHGRPIEQVAPIVNAETRGCAASPVATCLLLGGIVTSDSHALLLSRNGVECAIEGSASAMRNQAGGLLGAVLVFRDVTEQRRLSGEMTYRATHDALTGLFNRLEFESRLRRTLKQAHVDKGRHSLLYIDLDQFKLVNDACGHSAGDQLLQQVAGLLKDCVRGRDTLARLGGDEFALILEHCDMEEAHRVAQKICDRMDDFRFLYDGRRHRVGVSIGLAPLDDRWPMAESILQAADASCYAAKEGGRNRVHAWFDTDHATRTRHGQMQWAARLEHALDEDRFALHAQRIEPIEPGSAGLHAEVLLRMVDCDGSLVAPNAFLPAAERFNLAARIDRWVLRRTIEHLALLPDDASVDMLCVNLSGQSVGDRVFHQQAIAKLQSAGPHVCRRLCLEITETTAVTNLAEAAVFIEQARALGVRVALDDFGAGASSFGYLKTLRVDILKIDGQFIKDVLDDPLDDVAVRCFVDVARVVGMKTVAEFVDRPQVLQRLREIGVDYAQGFLLHRPEPIETVLATQPRDLSAPPHPA